MELKRRNFLVTGAAALAAASGVGWVWLRRRSPIRWLTAVRGGRYPGLVRPLDERAMKQPSKWIG